MLDPLFLGGELLGLVFLLQSVEQLIQLPIHHFLELVESEIDPMIRDTSLWEVVSADTLRSIPASNLQAT